MVYEAWQREGVSCGCAVAAVDAALDRSLLLLILFCCSWYTIIVGVAFGE